MLFVERSGRIEPVEFARYVARELAALGHRHLLQALSRGEAAVIAGWRGAQEMRALEGSTELIAEPSDA